MTDHPKFSPVASNGLEWLRQARCATPDADGNNTNLDLFFVEAGRTISEKALDMCRTQCPVRQECITHSYTRVPDGGMITAGYFGGLSLGQRKSMTLAQALEFAEKDTAEARAAKETKTAETTDPNPH